MSEGVSGGFQDKFNDQVREDPKRFVVRVIVEIRNEDGKRVLSSEEDVAELYENQVDLALLRPYQMAARLGRGLHPIPGSVWLDVEYKERKDDGS